MHFLEASRPYRALGANAMLFFDPVLRGVFGGDLASASEILADDTGIELLIARLEELDEEIGLGRLSGGRPTPHPGSIEAVTAEPRAFLAIDHGTATSSVALIGRVGGAWRLLGNLALPAGCRRRAGAIDAPRPPASSAADPGLADAAGHRRTRTPRPAPAPRGPQPTAPPAGGRRRLGTDARRASSHVAGRSGWRVRRGERGDARIRSP